MWLNRTHKMKMNKFQEALSLCLISIQLMMTSHSFAAAIESSNIININNYTVLIDSRKPVAGNGDTASSLFLVQNMIADGYTGVIDILADDRSEKIMKTIANQLPNFWDHVRILKNPIETNKIYSLVFRSGQPSGRILIDQLHYVSSIADRNQDKINVTKDCVFIATPIYGNSVNPNSIHPQSVIKKDENYKSFPAPGLNAFKNLEQSQYDLNDLLNNQLQFNESGIFHDPFSMQIRNWPKESIEKFIIDKSSSISVELNTLFEKTFRRAKSNDVGYTLAYGFSIGQVRKQAADYFRSLLAIPGQTVVITPSVFSQDLLAKFTRLEQQMIQVTNLTEFANQKYRFTNKKLIVIQIPNIPHHLFSALMLASFHQRRVPLGAGDGFFTTALSLGIPFAPTVVDWNTRNIHALGLLLQMQLNKLGNISSQNVIENLFPINSDVTTSLIYSQKLIEYSQVFKSTIQLIPNLYQSLKYQIVEQSENNQMANEKNFFISKYLSGVNPEITNKYCAYIFKN